MKAELELNIRLVKREEVFILELSFFKFSSEFLRKALFSLLHDILNGERIALSCYQWFIVPILKKGRTDYKSHCKTNFVSLIANVLALKMVRHLTQVLMSKFREQQAKFLPGRCYIDRIFILRQ